jgi:hypothetical protein
MTLVCKPRGRGNWRTVTLAIDGSHVLLPMLVRAGQTFSLGGVVFRICRVMP